MKRNNTIQWLYAVPKEKKLYILALMFVQALHGGSGVLYALLLRSIVDSATSHNQSGFWHYAVLTALLLLGQIGLRAILRWLNELSQATFENIFKARLTEQLLRKDYASISAVHSGEWLNRLTNDTVAVAKNYVEILPGMIGMIVKITSAVIMLIVLDWRFACVLLPCGALLIIMTYAFRRVLKRLHKQVQERDGKLRIFLQEHIGSMMIVRSFAAEKKVQEEAERRMAEHKTARMKKNHFSNFCNIGFGIAMHGMYFFGVCYCGYGILIGTISYGTLTAITQLISQIQSPFANITGYLPKFFAMIASAERLMEIENFFDDSQQPSFDIDTVKNFYTDSLRSFGLRNAEFSYYPSVDSIQSLSKDGMPTVLKHISLEIHKGEYVAFTGHSGCGKSTVLKLLMSIYRLDAGERYLDDTHGEKTLSTDWRRLFAYVPQGN